jgi:hypothetical protein
MITLARVTVCLPEVVTMTDAGATISPGVYCVPRIRFSPALDETGGFG